MIIERLSQEHRNIRKLLAILERESEVFSVGGRPDYEVIRSMGRNRLSHQSAQRSAVQHDAEDRFNKVRCHILELEEEAEADRSKEIRKTN